MRSIWFYSPIGNVWLCNPQHVDCCLVKLDEDTIMDLKKAKQLENLSHLRTHSIDTWSKRSDQPLKMLFATSWKLSCRMSTFHHYKVKYHSTFLVSLEAINLSNQVISWRLHAHMPRLIKICNAIMPLRKSVFSSQLCLNTTFIKMHGSHWMQENLSLNEGFDNSMARHAPFLLCKWKNSSQEYPKTYGGRDYLSTWSTYPYVLGHSCHEFFHLHDKNGGCRAANFRHQG